MAGAQSMAQRMSETDACQALDQPITRGPSAGLPQASRHVHPAQYLGGETPEVDPKERGIATADEGQAERRVIRGLQLDEESLEILRTPGSRARPGCRGILPQRHHHRIVPRDRKAEGAMAETEE